MKISLVILLLLIFLLAGCATPPVSTPYPGMYATQIFTSPATIDFYSPTGTATHTQTVIPPTSTDTALPPTPTFVPASLPPGLLVAYVVDDQLSIWNQNSTQMLVQKQNISAPVFSNDGQWILFRQRHISPDGSSPAKDQLWVIRSDGSELQRLVESDDLKEFSGEEASFLIDDIGWVPGSQIILFNTEKIVEGPPGSWPSLDLYSLDLAGQVTQLAKPGQGGRFVPSPDGSYVALATDSRIGLLNLQTGEQRTLLEFKPLELGCECLPIPKVVWDSKGNFLMTSIPPHKLYYPEEYHGEPEQVWRLSIDGQAEIVAQLRPVSQNHAGVVFSPHLQYFFYMNGFCPDAMGMLYVRNLTTGEEHPLTCEWNLPQWAPDDTHFIHQLELIWQLGNILENTNQPLEFLNVPTAPNVYAPPQFTWINDRFFLLVLRSQNACTLSIATLQGVVTEIATTPPDLCPRRVDFSLSQ